MPTGRADATHSVLDRAQQPGGLTFALIFVIVMSAWIWPHAMLDPLSVVGPMRPVIPVIISGVAGLSLMTLTILAYCLLMSGSSEINKKFVAVVLNRAGIGAAVGALVGIRVIVMILGERAETGDSPLSFGDCLSNIGNIITMFTFLFIATAMIYGVPAVLASPAALVRRFPPLDRFSDSLLIRRVAPFVMLFAINSLAVPLTFFLYFELRAMQAL